jgi:hypothetical protein
VDAHEVSKLAESQAALILRTMPESQYLDRLTRIVNAIENEIRLKQHFLYPRAAPHISPAVRQLGQCSGQIKEARSKPLRRAGIIAGNITANFFKVIQCQR